MWLAIFAFSCEAALAAVANLEGTSAVKCTALGAIVEGYRSLGRDEDLEKFRIDGRGPEGVRCGI